MTWSFMFESQFYHWVFCSNRSKKSSGKFKRRGVGKRGGNGRLLKTKFASTKDATFWGQCGLSPKENCTNLGFF